MTSGPPKYKLNTLQQRIVPKNEQNIKIIKSTMPPTSTFQNQTIYNGQTDRFINERFLTVGCYLMR